MRASRIQIDKLAARLPAQKQSKLRNKWTLCKDDLHKHQSAKEANRCSELRLLEAGGEVEELVYHPRFKLVVNGVAIFRYYEADFSYRDARTLVPVVEDVKGWKGGDRYRIFTAKKNLMLALYRITVSET